MPEIYMMFMMNTDPSVFQREAKLSPSLFSSGGKLPPASVLSLFQEIAIAHAETHGFGYDALKEKDLLWVVTQTRYELISHPAPEETVLLQTWFLPPRHGIVQREYLITDQQNGIYVKGSSCWVLMNALTRQLAPRLSEVLSGQVSYDVSNFARRARLLPKFESAPAQAALVTTQTAIDSNGHVNNVRYAEYMMAAAEHPAEDIRSFQIDYHKEMRCGEMLQLSTRYAENEVFVQGSNQDGQPVFLSRYSAANSL